ncbi:MAG: adenosylhomocysteinase [Thermofilum sp.]|uniref:Adenosylhomocysteinase n=1 Tax=Thermofilum pendens TaxID=2269 RepID=A0A7C4H7Y3_THEPE
MAEYKVRDISLADKGKIAVEWAEVHMPVVSRLRRLLSFKKPLQGVRIAACMHVTKETAVLMLTLRDAGAEVALSASNPLSTQDHVAAFLAREGVHVYAWRGMNEEEYFNAIASAASIGPHITMDDGGDLTVMLHKIAHDVREGIDYAVGSKFLSPDTARSVRGGTEETTTGVIRLKALEREGKLLYPVIAVNDSRTKYLFDNRFGTGQSTIDGILRATNILLAGKVVVVAGYGWVGRGIAWRARGMGARVVVVEADPIKALEAYYEGFEVTDMLKAASLGDVFITATGNINVIRREHLERMKDGAILANSGHFNVEISLKDLGELAVSRRRISDYVDEFTLRDGRRLYLLAEGRLVNLVAAEGHPSEVMDLSFGNQVLAVMLLHRRGGAMPRKVLKLPRSLDRRVARLKLMSLGVMIEKLTPEQVKYLSSWSI